jgi:IMP dehydrogenase
VDGKENFVTALRTSMGVCGATTIKEFQQAEMIVAPAIVSEGKSLQRAAVGLL